MENNIQEQQFEKTENKSKVANWLKRLGIVGFLFFFIKGIIWLLVIFGIGTCLQ